LRKNIEKMRLKRFNENNGEDVIQRIESIFDKHYSPESYEYIGEWDSWDDFIDSEEEEIKNQIKRSLIDADLEWIQKFISEEYLREDIEEDYEGKYVKIGYYVWDITGTNGETPDSFIEQICYHDEDREFIEEQGASALEDS